MHWSSGSAYGDGIPPQLLHNYVQQVEHNMTSLTSTESMIYMPYAAISAAGLVGGLLFLLFYCLPSTMSRGQRSRVKVKTTVNQLFNPGWTWL